MSRLLIFILIISFLFNNLSEAKNEKKLPSAVVVGTVYCDTCFQQDFSKSSYFISEASVAVQCGDGSAKPSFSKEVKTNKHGQFRVHLPFTVSKHVKRIKKCSVKLISSSESFCSVASRATSSSLHLKSRKQGVHIFSAGFFTFKPLKEPELCNQRPSLEASKQHLIPNPVTQDPTIPNIPSFTPTTPYLSPPILPNLPPLPSLPPLPPLPPLPGLPTLPPPVPDAKMLSDQTVSKHQTASSLAFLFPPLVPPLFPTPPPFGIPNPFQPPALLPPLPFQPPPPPLFNLPPVPGLSPPPSPPPPPFFNFPPVPGLSPPPSSPPPLFSFPPIPGLSPPPSPPPPPPPILPFPLPPLFPPPGGFPGIPPAPPRSKETSP